MDPRSANLAMPDDPPDLLQKIASLPESPLLECMHLDVANDKAYLAHRQREEYATLPRGMESNFAVSLRAIRALLKSRGRARGFRVLACQPYSLSTLLTRAMDALPGCFASAEPYLIFHLLPQIRELGLRCGDPRALEGWLDFGAALLSRTYHASETALLKTTIDTADLVTDFVRSGYCEKALFVLSDFESFLAQVYPHPERIKRTENTLSQVNHWCPGSEVFHPMGPLTGLQSVVLYWVSTRASYVEHARRFPESTLMMEVDEILADPSGALLAAGRFLGYPWEKADVLKAVEGEIFRRHAKGEHRPYGAADRRATIDKFIHENRSLMAEANEFRWELEALKT